MQANTNKDIQPLTTMKDAFRRIMDFSIEHQATCKECQTGFFSPPIPSPAEPRSVNIITTNYFKGTCSFANITMYCNKEYRYDGEHRTITEVKE